MPETTTIPSCTSCEVSSTSSKRIGMWALYIVLIAGVLFLLSSFPVFTSVKITSTMGYGVIFLLGLAASFSSCLSVTGGIVSGVISQKSEKNNPLMTVTRFSIGRVLAYVLVGGAIGTAGALLSVSPLVLAITEITAGLLMIILAFHSLGIFQNKKGKQNRIVEWGAQYIWKKNGELHSRNIVILGALTVLLPCGFTQGLQLYLLGNGGLLHGMITMGVFALGTLPSLFLIGAAGTYFRNRAWVRHLWEVAACGALVFGALSLWNGGNQALLAFEIGQGQKGEAAATMNTIQENGGLQIARMKVTGIDYTPEQFTVKKGIPVEWRIDGTKAVGCTQVIAIPELGITKQLLPDQETIIRFTPSKIGKIHFQCGMGMTSRSAAFTVVESL